MSDPTCYEGVLARIALTLDAEIADSEEHGRLIHVASLATEIERILRRLNEAERLLRDAKGHRSDP
jgi:hypothetical protein